MASKNTDYVVDYGKLVDGVEYTVQYVDSESGESIAPVYITQANIGETRSVSAPLQIVISGGAVYNLVSESTLEMILDAAQKAGAVVLTDPGFSSEQTVPAQQAVLTQAMTAAQEKAAALAEAMGATLGKYPSVTEDALSANPIKRGGQTLIQVEAQITLTYSIH